MAIGTAEDQFDWHGPAANRRRPSLIRYFKELIIPAKGHKVVPTSSGMLLIVVGLCLGLAAYNTESNILFAAFSLLLATLVLSGVICWVNFVSARWRISNSSNFRVGEESEFAVVVENAKKRFPMLCLYFDLDCPENDIEQRLYMKETLESGRSEVLKWVFKPTQRCVATLRIRDAVSHFPFGFLRKHVAGECSRTVSIWPKRISYQRFRGTAGGFAWQGQSTRRKGQSGELIGLRSYVKGDALSSIHWKVSAKQRRLVVRENASERQLQYSLYLDTSSYLWVENASFETMCSLASSVAEDLFLDSKLESCTIAGQAPIHINRVLDLETFFDALAGMRRVEKSVSEPADARQKNIVSFVPVEGGGVGAFVNGAKIAQA